MLHFKIALFPRITYSVIISGWYGCVTTVTESGKTDFLIYTIVQWFKTNVSYRYLTIWCMSALYCRRPRHRSTRLRTSFVNSYTWLQVLLSIQNMEAVLLFGNNCKLIFTSIPYEAFTLVETYKTKICYFQQKRSILYITKCYNVLGIFV